MKVAIVDYEMGNLFSVRSACRFVGLEASVTGDPIEISKADGLILPGVGAFGDAMAVLSRKDLTSVLREAVLAGKPILGICLGLQLLFSESHEFGSHRGLGILSGDVVRFESPRAGDHLLKVPHVGWNAIWPAAEGLWANSLLADVRSGEFFYFVHSFYVRPSEGVSALALSRYGDIDYCAAVQFGSVFACQFHPERSGPAGLLIYQAFANRVAKEKERV